MSEFKRINLQETIFLHPQPQKSNSSNTRALWTRKSKNGDKSNEYERQKQQKKRWLDGHQESWAEGRSEVSNGRQELASRAGTVVVVVAGGGIRRRRWREEEDEVGSVVTISGIVDKWPARRVQIEPV